MIAQQIDSSPHIFLKWIKRSSRKLIASWQQIVEIIDEYNQQQETVFDNQIYEQSSYQFTEDKFIQMKPSYFQVAKQLEKQIYIYFIENMSYLKWKQEFLILIFNNKTLALMNLNTFKPQLVISVKAIEKTKKKQSDNYMSILQRLDQQQSKDGWKKQINFYKKNNESVYERIDTSTSIKEKFDPIDQCKKDIEYLQKVVNLNPWDPELRPLNPDPKMQLVRKRGQSEHQKRFQNYESENYKATTTLQVQLLASRDNYVVLVLENLIIQFYQLEYDYKNSDYSLTKKHEFTLNDKIDQITIIENRWTKETHCLFFKQNWLLVFLIPEFRQIDKISINQSADTMHSHKILIVCQYDGLFSIIKENIRTTLSEQLYVVSIQKKVKYNDLKQSVQSLDYSHKYQLIIFGSMCTLVSIFNLRQNAFIYQFSILNSMQQCNQLNDKILRIFVFDSQNQYIVLFLSGYVSVWDLQRHKKVQEFVKQLPQNKNQQQYYSGLFLEHKAQLLIGGYNLQSWTSKINPIQLYDNYLDSNSSPVYT